MLHISFFICLLSSNFIYAQNLELTADYKAIPVNHETIRVGLRHAAIDFKKIFEIIPGTKSEELSWLNTSNLQKESFLNKTKIETQTLFSKNPEFDKIKSFLMDALTQTTEEEFKVQIADNHKIIINNENLVRTAYEIIGDQKTVLFSTTQFNPKKAAILGLYPSPQKDYVATLVSFDGNIDNSQLLIYSLKEKKIILNIEVTTWLEDVIWFSDNQVMYNHALSNSRGATLIIHDLKTQQKRQLINFGPFSYDSWVGYLDYASNDVFIKNLESGQQLNYKNIDASNIVEEDPEFFYLKMNSSKDLNGQILKLAKVNFSEPITFLEKNKGFNLSVFKKLKNKKFIATYSQDSQITIAVFNTEGKKLYQTILPDALQYSGVELAEGDDQYKLKLKTPFGTGEVLWKALESNPDYTEILKDAFKSKDLEIVTRIEYYKSADGEFIPARITHKKDLLINGNHPIFMEAYGGFNLMGYLNPTYSKIKQEFIRRGGILVGTGVRGGAERGYDWYKAGSGQNEMNTTLDVIAIAEGLVQNGYTVAKKIVLTGASNGGYVVANAALTSPQSFGLVIPINGVQDQLDFPTMDRWGLGWQEEYLNPYDPKDFKKMFVRAPLEIIPNSIEKPFLLIVNGENDSRVNKAHSYKLKAHLDDIWPNQSVLYSVEHAGHFATSSYLIDDIGVEANAHVWAEIFTHTGLQF